MKKNISTLLLLILSFMTLMACSNQALEPEEATLEISKNALAFANTGGEETVSIDSNQDKWSVYVIHGADWLSATKTKSGKLNIVAKENPKGEPRTGAVVVFAGTANEKIEVTQAEATTINFDLSPTSITMPKVGGLKFVSVIGSSDSWDLEEIDNDVTAWLTVTKTSSLIIFEATANNSFETRKGSIFARTSNGDIKEIVITQPGKTKYLLPYMNLTLDLRQLVIFEQGRGSVIKILSEPYDAGLIYVSGSFIFYSTSEAMPEIKYHVEKEGYVRYDKATTDIIYNPNQETPKELDEYQEFLKENGFIKNEDRSVKGLIVYENPKTYSVVTIQNNPKINTLLVSFVFETKQTEKYETFDSMPYGAKGVIDLLDNYSKKVADVIAHEASLGSVYDPTLDINGPVDMTQAGFRVFITNKYGKEEGQRGYWFYRDKRVSGKVVKPTPEQLQSVSEVDFYYTIASLGVWKDGNSWRVTDEFAALLKANGFVFSGIHGNYFIYKKQINSTKTLGLYIGRVRFSNVFEGAECLHLAYYHEFTESGTTVVPNSVANNPFVIKD